MPASAPLRRALVALLLSCALLAGTTACGSSDDDTSASATPTSSAEAQKFAKTRFVANAGLAAGATYQWIVKPFKAGKFKKGASGQKFAMVKAGVAGLFTYNRLKAAVSNAKGDPTLAKAVAPLSAGIESLKSLPSKLRNSDSAEGAAGTFEDVINSVKDAGKSAGAEITDKVPSAGQLTGS
ncbi:hypothetical protein [Streptomyces sp. NBC_01465]|uniref:hypothetical protein n=1 Tax=Streptomyces sp. NBC_01465 TaxID=2903878 RepID=UPI002E3169E6|nr:hypothetical protein [Streptomyces sp. NBC_01465]